jgi:hypothetical protein
MHQLGSLYLNYSLIPMKSLLARSITLLDSFYRIGACVQVSFPAPSAPFRNLTATLIETYVHPASHAGAPNATGTAPIYGNRFRLKDSFDDSSFSDSAKVVIRALKKYGKNI